MQTIDFIRAHGLDELCGRYFIRATRHKQHPNLVHLKYSQIESPMNERVVQECRGLILDEADDWRVVCRSYDKFFNAGEPNAAAIEWASARVYEKLDGSLMTLYWYAGAWQVASSGTPDASGPVNSSATMTFRELFWKTFNELQYPLPPDEYRGKACFMFELMTPLNRVIVPHASSRLMLHGARWLTDMQEMPLALELGWQTAPSFTLSSFDDCIEAAKTLKPMECEGYVVVDRHFNRIKVKSPQYVALSHLKEGMSARRLLEIVRMNESDEFLAHFPEWTGAYNRVRGAFDGLILELENRYREIAHLTVQKEFAGEALKTRCSAALFALRGGKCKTVREYLSTATFPSVERAVGLDSLAREVEAELAQTSPA